MEKKKSKQIILNAIKQLGKKLNKYPYYFVNEEDIRSELYHKLSTHFKHRINLVCGKEENKSNSIHSDSIILDKKDKKHKPDLLIYYASGKIPIRLKKGRIHFFGNVNQSKLRFKNNIKRRRIIEIKVFKSEKGRGSSIYKKCLKDYKKRRNIDFIEAYIILIDRGSKITGSIKNNLKSIIKDDRFNIIYIGCLKGKRRIIFLFRKERIKEL